MITCRGLFQAPQPPLPWIGIRNATEHGNICPQFDILNTNMVIPGSEDCLFLNVYTPNLKPRYLLPIIFFIHGGGFLEGSGNDDLYGPDFLINQNDVIVVTINYRLNILGFITLDSEEAPGNGGLKDQVAALRWVRRNIRNFGGDPERVTIFGESAGGSSCTLHALSQMSRGLFRRVIVTSGVPVSLFTVAFDHEQNRRPFVLAKKLGFRTTDTSELLRFLRTVPVERLINVNDSIVAGEDYISFFGKTYYVPVVEKDFGQERFIAETPLLSVSKGLSDVDLLVGHNSEEGLLAVRYLENSSILADYDRYPEVLVPRDVYYRTTPQMHLELADSIREYYTGSRLTSLTTIPVFVSYVTDLFIYPVLRYARRLTNAPRNGNVYLFQFSSLTERNVESRPGSKYGIIGVSHLDDLEYVFQANKYNLPVDKRALSYKIIQQICALYTNFAIFG